MYSEYKPDDFCTEAIAANLEESISELSILRYVVPEAVYKAQILHSRFKSKRLVNLDFCVDEAGDNKTCIEFKKFNKALTFLIELLEKTLIEFKANGTYNVIIEFNSKYASKDEDKIKILREIASQNMSRDRLKKEIISVNKKIAWAQRLYQQRVSIFGKLSLAKTARTILKLNNVQESEDAKTKDLKLFYDQKIEKLQEKRLELHFKIMDEEDIHTSVMNSLQLSIESCKSEMKMWTENLDTEREDWENQIFYMKVLRERQKLYLDEARQVMDSRTGQQREYAIQKLQEFKEKLKNRESAEIQEKPASLASRFSAVSEIFTKHKRNIKKMHEKQKVVSKLAEKT